MLTLRSAVLLAVIGIAGIAQAGPPTTASGKSGGWLGPLNPTTWSWPSMPWSNEPPRIKKKSQGFMSDMNQSAKRGWTRTKQALDPSWMLPSDKPKSSGSSDEGFFGSIFTSDREPKKIETVNEFLSQPHPR